MTFFKDEKKDKGEFKFYESYFEVSKNSIHNRNGDLTGQVLVFHNISSIKQKNIEIEGINTQLKLVNNTKDLLFKVVSHDLKGPIGNISNLLEFYIDNDEIVDKKKLQTLFSTTSNVYALIENLLHWANSQNCGFSVYPKLNLISKTILLAQETIQYQLNNKGVRFVDKSDVKQTAFYDVDSLEVVLRNLFSNAIKFSHPNGKIEVSTKVKDDFVCIDIRDDGIGMSADVIKCIRGNLVVNSESGTNGEKGTGIGLRLCQDIINANKGKLEFSSQVDKGTIITILLPVSE